MNQIWKYPLELREAQVVIMPAGAELLTVQVQNGTPCLWAKVDPRQEKVKRVIVMAGTGHEDEFGGEGDYIATIQMDLVWHWFDGGLDGRLR